MDDKFQNLKIMVIDDSKTIRRTAETLLQREGYEVITAVDGFEALSKNCRSKSRYRFCRYYDAAPGWLSNLRLNQKLSELPEYSCDYAIE